MTDTFLLRSAKIQFDEGQSRSIDFLGPHADKLGTHITILAGANGTSKSRILASLVEQLSFIKENNADPKRLRGKNPSSHGLLCNEISTIKNDRSGTYSNEDEKELKTEAGLPSRILVLSNLVADRFHFPQGRDQGEQYYRYLGARQGTNMMTSGSMERSVTEAILQIISSDDYVTLYREWLGLIFSGKAKLAFSFPRLSRSAIERYMAEKDKVGFIRDRLQQRFGRLRSIPSKELPVEETEKMVTELFDFLAPRLKQKNVFQKIRRGHDELMLDLDELTEDEKSVLSKISPLLVAASRVGFSPWPSLSIESTQCLQFHQLSSGEQNLIATGAKLIAHAKPGCLVAIDEPEVSLNVGWQQKYMDLIQASLKFAKGSHVLIATHSPHVIASIPAGQGSIILVEKKESGLTFSTKDAHFEGWGSESVLYKVLGIPSASSHFFNMELTRVLSHIQSDGRDKELIDDFLSTASRLDFDGNDPIEEVFKEIVAYRKEIQ